MSVSPKDQHAIQAKKILARRANSTNNTTGKQTPAKKTVAPKAPVVDLDDPATHGNVPDTNVNPFEGKSRKELRALCDDATPAIEYKKKDTIPMLIEKLKG